MDTTQFHDKADATLEALENAVEEGDCSGEMEAELQDGILSILTPHGTFVVNKHAPSLQLWYSSPLSGAARFNWDEATQAWNHAASHEALLTMLERELPLAGLKNICN